MKGFIKTHIGILFKPLSCLHNRPPKTYRFDLRYGRSDTRPDLAALYGPCHPPPSALISATVASRRWPSRLSAVRSLASCAACTVVTLR
jgi:hypothetical protein